VIAKVLGTLATFVRLVGALDSIVQFPEVLFWSIRGENGMSVDILVHAKDGMDISCGDNLVDGRCEDTDLVLAPKHRHEFKIRVNCIRRPCVIPVINKRYKPSADCVSSMRMEPFPPRNLCCGLVLCHIDTISIRPTKTGLGCIGDRSR